MTYIEFFNNVAIENVCACLTNVPKRVIYIGRDTAIIESKIKKYNRVFSDRGHNIEFIPMAVERDNLENAVSVLQKIVDTYPDCAFGITGGDEIALMAFGIVYERNRNKNIQIHRFNIAHNTICDCDKDGKTVYKDLPVLSAEENIQLYGGDVLYGDVFGDDTYMWDFTEDFVKDIENIWNVCKGNVRLWNTQISVFEAAFKVGVSDEDKLYVTAEKDKIKRELDKNHASYKIVKGMVNYLKKHGLLTHFSETDTELSLGFKNPQVRRCLIKAGQALEMKTLLIARSLQDDNGNKLYNDAVNGVLIDWDGRFHNESVDGIYDTENEIDILLMHGIVPVFISCKNGVVDADELYKLNTVALRFGGKYAKKVLVATSIPKEKESGKYLIQRARDMNIKLITDVQKFNTDDEFKAKMLKLWR
ncbi:MAG: hypothetical protein U0L72_06145 [Acutalibacteraceae bacterium]|nr:hypothetical protein [Acutalibacteraceae bacterium]